MEIPRHQGKRRARLEIVPLIDIIFFLLAAFVLVSLSMVKNKGIPVVLPKAATGESSERQEHLVIGISEAGQYYLDKREMPEAELSPNSPVCRRPILSSKCSFTAMKTRALVWPSPFWTKCAGLEFPR